MELLWGTSVEVQGIGAAVAAAFAEQRSEGSGYGVGISHGDEFVQWCREDSGELSHVEVRVDPRRNDASSELADLGFVVDADLAEYGIVVLPDASALTKNSDDDAVATALGSLLAMIGATDQTTLTVYP